MYHPLPTEADMQRNIKSINRIYDVPEIDDLKEIMNSNISDHAKLTCLMWFSRINPPFLSREEFLPDHQVAAEKYENRYARPLGQVVVADTYVPKLQPAMGSLNDDSPPSPVYAREPDTWGQWARKKTLGKLGLGGKKRKSRRSRR